jgi:hypothetical protein
VIFDAEMLYGFFVVDSKRHWGVAGEVELAAGFEELIVSPFVIAELEPMVTGRLGPEAWLAVLEQLAGGAWTIAAVDLEHLAAVRERVAAGEALAAASVAVLSEGDDS